MNNSQTDYIIFFDGYCNLCNGFIDFIISIDKDKKFKFASLQGETFKELIDDPSLSELKTVVLLKNENIYKKSTAVIEIISEIYPLFGLTKILKFFPFRDYMYDLISKNRYSLFGKKDTCRLPTQEEKDLFLP